MEGPNLTLVTEFILLDITDCPELQPPLFILFLIIYLTSLLGNLRMIILTQVDPRLQTPTHFFLRHLVFTDLGYSTAVEPKMLVNFVVDQNTISYYKAFLACRSHLTVVLVFYGTLLFIYLQPKPSHTFHVGKVASLFYTLAIPMLNPLIYSLGNEEVKDALKRTFTHRFKIPT
ncbi:Olfactory receptor 8K3 [Heterocephalus glaber]|uniref:Olfactory receptor 8K3 n=1 Tax=Heterocephalus glaber TaxID=10181 RepID=G5C8N5_HETGA|nr:Olfactory receptor 8K3 [Heterocephalus glaber]